MSRPPRTWPWMLAAVFLLSAGLGHIDLLDPDEGRYAGTSREMLASGDLIVPAFNGSARLSKPPLIYWLQAGAFALLGPGEIGARLPSALAALCTLALVARWARRRLGADNAAPAVAALATTVIFFAIARLAITDMLLLLWITATLLLWDEAVQETDRRLKSQVAMAAALAGGMAVLTKGPVGIALPALVIIATAVACADRRMVTVRGAALGLAGTILVVGPWVAGLAARIDMAEGLRVLRREVLERAVSGLEHPRPLYYLFATFWPTFLPWSIALAVVLFRSLRTNGRRDDVGRFLVTWVVTVVIFFSVLPDKNDAYLLPAAPAVALIIARSVGRRAVFRVAGVTAVALLAILWAISEPISQRRSMKSTVRAAGLDRIDDYHLLAYRIEKPSLVFYAGRHARWLTSEDELRQALDDLGPDRRVAIVMTRRRYDSMGPGCTAALEGFELLDSPRRYSVFWRDPAGSSGDP